MICVNNHFLIIVPIETSNLSPMNLLVVTLWHLKHYHSEQYFATDLNLHQSTVNYFLSAVVNILHDCVDPELISLPVDMANRESGLLEHVNDSVHIIADKAYIGEDYVVIPRKKPHRRELTDEDKEFNRDINSARAAIENINQHLKAHAILGSIHGGGAIDNFEKVTKIVQVVSAL